MIRPSATGADGERMGFGNWSMARRLGMAIAVALMATACGSPATTPPPAATPAPTADPRHDEIDQAQARWDAKGPKTVAYTTTESVGGSATTTVHVTEMDGRVEALVLEAGAVAPDDGGRALSIDGLFETAREALDGSGTADFDIDQLYGYLPRLGYESDVADGSFTIEVRDMVTAADRTAAGAARDGLNAVLQRWDQLESPAWEYTWTRYGAADTEATQTAYRIRHGNGQTTLATPDGEAGGPPPPEATIEGTIEAAVSVMASGGWVDVALDPNGLDTLIAIDPSPSSSGDADVDPDRLHRPVRRAGARGPGGRAEPVGPRGPRPLRLPLVVGRDRRRLELGRRDARRQREAQAQRGGAARGGHVRRAEDRRRCSR